MVTAEIPGIAHEDIQINVVNDTLTVIGECKPTETDPEARYHRQERGSGKFSRSIELPYAVDSNKVEASFNNGVLHISLPRKEAEKPKKIVIKTAYRRPFIPRADIYETDNHSVVVVDIPGAEEDGIDITLEKDILTIRADVEPEEPAGYTLSFVEYEVGDYQRSFKLTDEVDQEEIQATYKEGVLRLYLPKSDRARTRKIAIKKG